MDKSVSRRSFLKNSALALCAAAVCDFSGMGSAMDEEGDATLPISGMSEQIVNF